MGLTLAALLIVGAPDARPDADLARGWTWALVAPQPARPPDDGNVGPEPRPGIADVTAAAPLPGGDLLIGGVVQGPIRLGATIVRDGAKKIGFVARLGAGAQLRNVHLLDSVDPRVKPADEPAITALLADGSSGFIAASRRHPLFAMSAAGKMLWSVHELPRAFALALASNGDLLAAGCDRTSGSSEYPGVGATDDETKGYVARLSSDGRIAWRVDLVRRGGDKEASNCGTAIAADSTGGAYVAGNFDDEVAIGGEVLVAGGRNGFVARLSPNGRALWARVISSVGSIRLAALPDGRVVVRGEVGAASDPAREGITALDPAGRFSWFLPAETSPAKHGRFPIASAVLTSAGDDILWAGYFLRSVRIGDRQLDQAPGAESGVFVARVASDGHVISLSRIPAARGHGGWPFGQRAWPAAIVSAPRSIWIVGRLRGISRGAFAHRLERLGR